MPSHGRALLLDCICVSFRAVGIFRSRTTADCANPMKRINNNQNKKKGRMERERKNNNRLWVAHFCCCILIAIDVRLWSKSVKFCAKKTNALISFVYFVFYVSVWLGPDGIDWIVFHQRETLSRHTLQEKEETQRDEDGAGTTADDVFSDDVVQQPPTVWGDGRHTRRLPGGMHGDSSHLPQREEHSHVYPTEVQLAHRLLPWKPTRLVVKTEKTGSSGHSSNFRTTGKTKSFMR